MYSESMPKPDRPPYGYEQALDRVIDQRRRLDEQIDRLASILSPVLESELSKLGTAINGQTTAPAYASALLQSVNNQADNLALTADRLESIIGRIRL